MALLFLDGFDHYAAGDVLLKWTSGSAISLVAGRLGGSACREVASTNLVRAVAFGSTTVWAGFALRIIGMPGTNSMLVNFGEVGLFHAGVVVNSDGSLSGIRGGSSYSSVGATLGTSAVGVVSGGVWLHIQVKITVHDTAGSIEVRLNGSSTPVLNLTGVDTRNAGTGVVSTFGIGCGGTGTFDYDDLYVGDSTGSAPWNSFLGDCRVDPVFPTGAGANTAWTPSTGANWQTVDDNPPNSDTDYTSTSTVGATDTFAHGAAPVVGGTIYAVQQVVDCRKTDAGVCALAAAVKHGGTVYLSPDYNPSTTYSFLTQLQQTNPGTSAAWVESDFNAAEIGYRRTA